MREFSKKSVKNCQKSTFRYLEKGVSRTSSGRHASTEKDRALWFFSTGLQRTNLNLQTGLRSNGVSVPEKSRFSDMGGWKGPPPMTKRVKDTETNTIFFLKLKTLRTMKWILVDMGHMALIGWLLQRAFRSLGVGFALVLKLSGHVSVSSQKWESRHFNEFHQWQLQKRFLKSKIS